MPIEVANTIEQLDETWPLNGDPLAAGASHIRLVKKVLKQTFPGSGGDGYAALIQADETEWGYCAGLTSSIQDQINASSGAMVPTQGVIPYAGLFANIPANYQLCDGTNGTPNLTDKFIVGTATEGDVGNTGGSKDSALVDHKHTFSHSHSGFTDFGGAHTHTIDLTNVYQNINWGKGTTSNVGTVTNQNTESVSDHSHSLTVNSTNVTSTNATPSNNGSNANMPAYLKLAFIVRMT